MLKSPFGMSTLSRRTLILLALVSLLAFCLRLYRLDEIPPGLHHDEALNGIEARDLLRSGNRPIYIGSGFNGEPLLEYSMMLSEAAFGQTAFAVRLPAALYGVLTMPVVFLLVLELSRRTRPGYLSAGMQALACTFILATLYWHLNASREGYKPVFLPLFCALTFLCLLKALHSPRAMLWTVLAGLTLGLGFYTYPSIRFLYPVVALFILFSMWRDRPEWRSHLARAASIGLLALIVFAPLGAYYVQHPDAFFTRQNQVGIWVTQPGGLPAALLDNALKVAGMFFVRGDLNPRQNLPGRPALDWILAAGFVLGLARALWGWKQPTNFLVLAWLAAMLVPTVVTDAAPNFLRSLGAVVPAVILVVRGYDALLGWIAAHAPRGVAVSAHGAWAILLLISALFSLDAYFDQFPRDPRTWYAFDVGLVKIGQIVRALPADTPVYLTPFSSEQATIVFTLDQPRPQFKWFDGRKCIVAPPSERSATMLVVAEDYRSNERVPLYWAGSTIVQTIADFGQRNYLTEYQIPAQAWNFSPSSAHDDVFGNQLRLVGYSLPMQRVQAGEGVPLILFWRAQQPPSSDYTIFTHLLGANNPRLNAPLWGQNDHQPCAGGYPTTRWGLGETIAEDFLIFVDKDAPAGSYPIELGVYELESGARLMLPDGSDHLLIGPVEIFQ